MKRARKQHQSIVVYCFCRVDAEGHLRSPCKIGIAACPEKRLLAIQTEEEKFGDPISEIPPDILSLIRAMHIEVQL